VEFFEQGNRTRMRIFARPSGRGLPSQTRLDVGGPAPAQHLGIGKDCQ
jgi:hypothetical protein